MTESLVVNVRVHALFGLSAKYSMFAICFRHMYTKFASTVNGSV